MSSFYKQHTGKNSDNDDDNVIKLTELDMCTNESEKKNKNYHKCKTLENEAKMFLENNNFGNDFFLVKI